MYQNVIQKIKDFDFWDKNNSDYLYALWMCNEIEKMTDPYKAGRWIGYATRMVEELGFWSNQESRDYTREDVKNGNDRI